MDPLDYGLVGIISFCPSSMQLPSKNLDILQITWADTCTQCHEVQHNVKMAADYGNLSKIVDENSKNILHMGYLLKQMHLQIILSNHPPG